MKIQKGVIKLLNAQTDITGVGCVRLVMRILRASCAMALAFHPTTSSNRHVGITK
jgi:hypothetical protein